MGFAALYPSYTLRLFDFFAQHFEFEPAVLGGGELVLRLGDRR